MCTVETPSGGESNDPQDRVPQRDALIDALDALPHAQRAVIALRYGIQLSEAETASTLDIPIGTVKSRVNRALARLREVLDAETGGRPAVFPATEVSARRALGQAVIVRLRPT